MPSVEAIRKITIQASTPGVDQSTSALNNLSAAQNRVTLSANQLQISMASAQKLIDDNVQKLQQLKSANDNVGQSYTDLIGKARDVSGSFSETVENILNTINHLKLLAVAAYAMSPALRGIINSDVRAGFVSLEAGGKQAKLALDLLAASSPLAAAALSRVEGAASKIAPAIGTAALNALSFFGRIAGPIAVAVGAWKLFNYTVDLGAGLLDKYGNAERSLFGVNVDKNLASLTKFQGTDSDIISPDQVQQASELSNRLKNAKDDLAEFAKIQLNLTGPALALQGIWVGIVELIAKAADGLAKIEPLLAARSAELRGGHWRSDNRDAVGSASRPHRSKGRL